LQLLLFGVIKFMLFDAEIGIVSAHAHEFIFAMALNGF
jgi:hypothetical protein